MKRQLDQLLAFAQNADACEVLIMAGDIPAMRVHGDWHRCDQARRTPADVEALVQSLLPGHRNFWQDLLDRREIEFDHRASTGEIFKCNAHFQRGSLVLLVRLVDDSIIDPDASP